MAACTAALSLGAAGASEGKRKHKLLQSFHTIVLRLWHSIGSACLGAQQHAGTRWPLQVKEEAHLP